MNQPENEIYNMNKWKIMLIRLVDELLEFRNEKKKIETITRGKRKT